MGFTDDLLTGLARQLDTADVGVWNSTGIYTDDQIGIVIGRLPDQPSNAIALAAYGVDDSNVDGDDTVGVQVRTRCDQQDPRPGLDLADHVFEQWHSAHDLTLPNTVFVKQILRRSWVSGGIDDNQRSTTIQNFYVQLPRATVHRP